MNIFSEPLFLSPKFEKMDFWSTGFNSEIFGIFYSNESIVKNFQIFNPNDENFEFEIQKNQFLEVLDYRSKRINLQKSKPKDWIFDPEK